MPPDDLSRKKAVQPDGYSPLPQRFNDDGSIRYGLQATSFKSQFYPDNVGGYNNDTPADRYLKLKPGKDASFGDGLFTFTGGPVMVTFSPGAYIAASGVGNDSALFGLAFAKYSDVSVFNADYITADFDSLLSWDNVDLHRRSSPTNLISDTFINTINLHMPFQTATGIIIGGYEPEEYVPLVRMAARTPGSGLLFTCYNVNRIGIFAHEFIF